MIPDDITKPLSPSPDKCLEAIVQHNNRAVEMLLKTSIENTQLRTRIRELEEQLAQVFGKGKH